MQLLRFFLYFRLTPEEIGLPWLDLGHVPEESNGELDFYDVTAYPRVQPKKESTHPKIDEEVSRKQRKALLGKLSSDLDYLEHLVNDVKIGEVHDHDKRGRVIRNEAKDAITFLQGRQEFWGQYKPLYSK